jgi:DNA-binding LacI/PurR family transcriptional regulator
MVPNAISASPADREDPTRLQRGRRRIGALGVDVSQESIAAVQRSDGCRRALVSAGVDIEAHLLVGPVAWTRASGADLIAWLLDSVVRFDAVFGFNDALGAMAEIQRSRPRFRHGSGWQLMRR